MLAGLDIGTTGCKCTVYNNQGEFVNQAYREYEDNDSEHQLNLELVWEKVLTILKEAVQNIDRLDAIGVSSFGESFVLLDENDKVLMDSMLYTDPRGKKQCSKIIKRFGNEYLNQSTGLKANPMYSISKLMWVKENRSEIYDRTKYIFLVQDFIVYKLSGIRQIDYSLASRTMAFDINKLSWNEKILSFAGIEKNKLSKPVATGSRAGFIKKELAKKLNLNQDLVIVSGGHDQIAAAVGAGITDLNMAVDGIGTVECITPVFSEAIDRSVMHDNSYAIIPFLKANYVSYAFTFTGGALLKWYRDKIADLETEKIRKRNENPYHYFNKKVDLSAPSSLLILPYFSGAATPYMDNSAKGVIIGLSTESKKSDIYQALMEAVSFEMFLNMEKLEEAGIKIKELRATGGGSRSQKWLQMKANIYGKKIKALANVEAGSLGSIMLAGTACGIYKDLQEAENVFIKDFKIYKPNLNVHKKYLEKYQKYKKIYPALKPFMN